MIDTSPSVVFPAAVARAYERHLVPMLFEPFARELAARAAVEPVERVLEIAAGTGALTRALAERFGPDVPIVATDLGEAMLERAASMDPPPSVVWQVVDAHDLPFADASFGLVTCQFGVMFFADRVRAHTEVHRTLVPGGRFLFSAWDALEENPFAATVFGTLAELWPDDPPDRFASVPFGYHNADDIAQDLAEAGFTEPAAVDVVTLPCTALDARAVAEGFCLGTPLHEEIVAHGPDALERAVASVAARIGARFDRTEPCTTMQALLVEARR